ncbi:hypothetical protein P3X46_027076 [Hevea brasiliensis]|uniref:B box-type domain-containing protein n=1 Tax=Hevea brasiliensis TaxID=3981 RepID=A0ABQ9L0D0_HEVBR|nr:uncharacterized protein LOC110653360 [Hevea brasiliensis]KAJ9153658.1 hypothetical protein P3X46_027076 [Hevea brasiliensis]
MKGCELCGGTARMYCESDQASLCWDCDEKVHCANFLVAKHCRTLLCQVCQSPTPWKASGPKLGPTVSICESCFSLHNGKKGEVGVDRDESHGGNEQEDEFLDDSDDYDDEDDEQDDEEEDEEEEEDEDGENQVVPWSVTSPSPPAASSSSSEEEISSRFLGASAAALKRMRENSADIDSDDENGCSSCHTGRGRLSNDEGDSMASYRPLKQARTSGGGVGGEVEDDPGQAESRSTAIIDSLNRLQSDTVSNRESTSATILAISRLSGDHSR